MTQRASAGDGPQFIAVGPEKTGTTWMHANLDAHPDVRLPPIKELRYFWEKHFYPTRSLWQRLGGKQRWHRQQFWRVAGIMLALGLGSPVRSLVDGGDLRWYYRYLMRHHDDQWYRQCFRREPGRITGEISPQYFFLRPEEVRRVAPDAKIIVSLRRPADWVWSLARMNERGGYLDSHFGSLDAFIDYQVTERSFCRSVGLWQQHFPSEQLLVLFYDDLVRDPWAYYQRICGFLGIEPSPMRKQLVGNPVNVGGGGELPDTYLSKVDAAWRDDIEGLAQLVPDVPAAWREGHGA